MLSRSTTTGGLHNGGFAGVTESRPSTNLGVDYCGPFHIKEKRNRNRRQIKVYVAIFVCLAVKAEHIELVGDLTSETFIARRRFRSTIHSDNGTNLIGANNEFPNDSLMSLSERDFKNTPSNRLSRWQQRGQRALNAVASGSSYQDPARCRWYHPDSYSLDGKEHFGSERQKACSTAESTRSREIRITNDRDEIG